MTIGGAVNKSAVLAFLVVLGATFTWRSYMEQGGGMGLAIGSAIAAFIVAIVTVFKKEWSPYTAPLYAVLEGFFLGAISAMFEARFGGIVFNAVCLTLGTLFALLFIYRTGMIRVTRGFMLGVMAATGGIFLLYFFSFLLSLIGMGGMGNLIHGSGAFGIGFSIFVVVIAALNLVLDFHLIEEAARSRSPKYMEWFCAFGLMVTLVWLYIEILHLLAKLQSRD